MCRGTTRSTSIEPFTPPADVPQEDWRWQQQDIERVQEFRKCIECFLCQDVCHVLRDHETERPFMGPRYLVRTAGLEMHPMDTADRTRYLKDDAGIGYCNITKCCTEVCPEHIKITDNAIIPLKERVADEYYDPIQMVWRAPSKAPPSHASSRSSKADEVRARRHDAVRGVTLWGDEPAGDPPAPAAGRRFVIRTDGAARGNPGPASLGGAADRRCSRGRARPARAARRHDLRSARPPDEQRRRVDGRHPGARARPRAGRRPVDLFLDSKLIVEQLHGRWRVKDAKLQPLWAAAKAILGGFRRWSATHVPRALNAQADALANEALDRVAKGGPAAVVRRPR